MTVDGTDQGPWAFTARQLLEGPLRGIVGRATLYELLRTGTIRSVRAGKKIVVPATAIRAWLDGETSEAGRKPDGGQERQP